MRVVKIKNGIGFCAKKGCKHLMSTSFELIQRDQDGKKKKKTKFCLCEDCTFEFLTDFERKIEP